MIRNLIPIALLVASGLALTSVSSQAQLPYSDGDLILGFQAIGGTGTTTDYEVDLGPAKNFFTGGSLATGTPIALSLGPIGTDLASTYGSSWFSDANLQWSINGTQRLTVSGSPFSAKTAFSTFPETTLGTQASTPANLSLSQLNTLSANLNAQGTQYAKGTTQNGSPAGTLAGGDQVASSTSGVSALFQPTNLANSFAAFQPTSTVNNSYGTWVGGNLNDFTATNAGSASDLFEATTAGYTFMGAFQFKNDGTLYFDSARVSPSNYPLYATPEPSSAMMLVLGAGMFVGFFRRRTVAIA